MKQFQYPDFDYKDWTPQKHEIIIDSGIQNDLYEKGYVVIRDFIHQTEVSEINEFYETNHSIQVPNGGFFVSIYSKDLAYRKKVHDFLLEKLDTHFNSILTNFKYTCLNFAVKYPGPEGELFVHQDMAQVDEYKHSQVGIWIPLEKVTIENGTLGVLPHSHFSIPPHRSLYHDLPYSKIYSKIHEYVQPLEMNAGDLLLFDTRLLHNSFANLSNKPRKSVATSVIPIEAEFCITYRNEEFPGGEYEILKLEDDFFMTFRDFKSEKVAKPGASTGNMVNIKEAFVSEVEFEKFCDHFGLEKTNMHQALTFKTTLSVQEPTFRLEPTPRPSLIQRLKRYL